MKQEPTYLPHVACPSCGALSKIDYTIKGRGYTWWCGNDECGKQYQWMQNEDGSINAEPTGIHVKKTSTLLVLEPQKENIFLIVKGFKNTQEHNEYYYNEGTCPTNYLNESEEIYLGDHPDPHGLFKFVKSIDKRVNVGLDDFNMTKGLDGSFTFTSDNAEKNSDQV